MTLTEVLVTIGISSILTISGAKLAVHPGKIRTEAAAMALFAVMNQSRATAITTGRYAGIYMDRNPETGETVFWRIVDGNGNGIRKRDIRAGIDKKIGKCFTLERDYPMVRIKRLGLTNGIISFSPAFKSSTGSVIFYTDDPSEGEIRIKLYGLSTLTRPVRILPDGSERAL